MWTLADVPGRYPVGATTFATPISNDGHVIGKSKLIAGASSGGKPHAPALLLKEVVVTAYYPADTSHNETKKGMAWLTRTPKTAGPPPFGALGILDKMKTKGYLLHDE